MSTPLCFIDTETTGVHPDRRVWEVAIIRRDDEGQREYVWQVSDVDLSNADPFGLNVGRFYERHHRFNPSVVLAYGQAGFESEVAREVEIVTRGAHLIGVVPSFDAGCLDPMLRRHRLIPAWHYHLVDVEAMAAGWLRTAPPWKSDELSRACEVEPPSDDERHTALGDARWAMRWYDALTGVL